MLGSKFQQLNKLKLLFDVCRIALTLIAFVISSIYINDDLLWMCVWCLSIIKLVEIADEKI
tara:strand:+ start:304 stop:486 length:183 start_codon:yes stop_codon:yes gene_type:complete